MTEATTESKIKNLQESHSTIINSLNRHENLIMDIRDRVTEDEPAPKNDELFAALAKAQGQFKSAQLDAEGQVKNRRYNYATLASVIDATREGLTKNGLSVLQLPERANSDGGEVLGLTTILAHQSGQYIQNYFEMQVPDPTPQGIGSAMTYMRRYARMSILDISGANDDDAEGSQPKIVVLKPEQADEIFTKADELFGDDADDILKSMCTNVFQVDAVANIPIAGFEAAMKALDNKKKRQAAKKAPTQKKPADAEKKSN